MRAFPLLLALTGCLAADPPPEPVRVTGLAGFQSLGARIPEGVLALGRPDADGTVGLASHEFGTTHFERAPARTVGTVLILASPTRRLHDAALADAWPPAGQGVLVRWLGGEGVVSGEVSVEEDADGLPRVLRPPPGFPVDGSALGAPVFVDSPSGWRLLGLVAGIAEPQGQPERRTLLIVGPDETWRVGLLPRSLLERGEIR